MKFEELMGSFQTLKIELEQSLGNEQDHVNPGRTTTT